jgi:hypothetical protein
LDYTIEIPSLYCYNLNLYFAPVAQLDRATDF